MHIEIVFLPFDMGFNWYAFSLLDHLCWAWRYLRLILLRFISVYSCSPPKYGMSRDTFHEILSVYLPPFPPSSQTEHLPSNDFCRLSSLLCPPVHAGRYDNNQSLFFKVLVRYKIKSLTHEIKMQWSYFFITH